MRRLESAESKCLSHPTGVRGLKSKSELLSSINLYVAPHWGAWIEIASPLPPPKWRKSHPTGVRGLKLHDAAVAVLSGGRTPLGCVD